MLVTFIVRLLRESMMTILEKLGAIGAETIVQLKVFRTFFELKASHYWLLGQLI